jgi:hypothetical protein
MFSKSGEMFFFISGCLHLLHLLLLAGDLWRDLRLSKMGRNYGTLYLLFFHDLGANLCHLFFGNNSWNPKRAMDYWNYSKGAI